MRKFIIAMAVAATAITGAAVPSYAAGLSLSLDAGQRYDRQIGVQEVQYYNGYHRKKRCWWKKVRRYDSYGNRYWERVRVCRH